ncbi:TetR/AcrR family transcriptional regulator C-terminal domain-containing protein [Bacillus sp. CFBP9009]
MSTNRKEDPRAIRSKKMLKNAVFTLLAENLDISQLTVQKIANRAELNRATFYLHYADINDLLRQIVHEVFDDLSTKFNPLIQNNNMNEQEQLISFLDYIYEYRKFFAVLFEDKGFKNSLFKLIKNTVEMQRSVKNLDLKENIVAVDILAASLLGIIMWWITDGIHFSSEYIASQIISMYKKDRS